jgi:hypothetical protein
MACDHSATTFSSAAAFGSKPAIKGDRPIHALTRGDMVGSDGWTRRCSIRTTARSW